MEWLWAALIVLILIGLFILAYIANHRTPKPKGCEHLQPDCEGCHIDNCGLRNKIQEAKEKEQKTEIK